MYQLFFHLLVLLFIVSGLNAQCFTSPGNPIAGASNVGNMNKKVLRINFYNRYGYSDQYYHGSQPHPYSLYEKAKYNYVGNTLAYGITDRTSIDIETGYFINKTLKYNNSIGLNKSTISGSGLTHSVLSLKRNLFHEPIKKIKWTIGIGAKIPLRFEPQSKEGSELPIDAQPSMMSYGTVLQSYFIKENSMYSYRIFLINRYEYHFKNANDFKYGQALYNALFYSKKLYLTWPKTIENFTLIMQIRNEFRTRNHNYYLDNSEIKASGSNLFFLVPQINYSIGETWNISFLVDIPVYSYYNETQLAQKYSFSFSLNKDIIFK